MRSAFADLLDQRTPFGRLALTHVFMTAGDALVTISLAGSLFFSISPTAAKGKVLLYLLLTMAPFAVVAPALGPLIDRSRGARRAMVVTSAVVRVLICPFMARDVHGLLLFPEAFTMLVMSKLYLVTRGALVPAMAAFDAGAAGEGGRDQLATLNARLGLLASLAGFVAAVPAVIVLKLLGAPGVLWLDAVVFVCAAVAGARLPVLRGRSGLPAADAGGVAAAPEAASDAQAAAPDEAAAGERAGWAAAGEGGLRAPVHPEVLLALMPMSLVRGMVGFLTFLLAFGLRRAHIATIWYGVVLAGSTAGALLGVLSVARLRRWLTEQQILMLGIAVIVVAALTAAFVPGIGMQAVLALGVGLAGSICKPSFDALAQRYVPPPAQGRAFARFETRLQLVWVLGGLLPVLLTLPVTAGDVLIAVVAVATGVSYIGSRKALRHRAWPGHRI